MKLKEKRIIKIFEEVSTIIEGDFSMSFQKVNGGAMSGGIYHTRIDKKYDNTNVQIYTGLSEFALQKDEYESCDIMITATKDSREDIELSIWRKDYMDKIFPLGKSSTGWKEFDKVIGVKASKNSQRHLHKVFENERLRKELIEDKYRTYNIQTVDHLITLKRKSSLRMENSDMVISEYNRFLRFLDGLIAAKVL